jgi:hypothetical protein
MDGAGAGDPVNIVVDSGCNLAYKTVHCHAWCTADRNPVRFGCNPANMTARGHALCVADAARSPRHFGCNPASMAGYGCNLETTPVRCHVVGDSDLWVTQEESSVEVVPWLVR